MNTSWMKSCFLCSMLSIFAASGSFSNGIFAQAPDKIAGEFELQYNWDANLIEPEIESGTAAFNPIDIIEDEWTAGNILEKDPLGSGSNSAIGEIPFLDDDPELYAGSLGNPGSPAIDLGYIDDEYPLGPALESGSVFEAGPALDAESERFLVARKDEISPVRADSYEPKPSAFSIREYELAKETAGGDPSKVGHPHAQHLIKMMYDDILAGLNKRNMATKYGMFRNYAGQTLNNTRGINTGSEIDGRYRLSWYDRMYRDPIRSVFEVEEFSRVVHAGLIGDHEDLAVTFARMREKLDVPARTDGGVKFSKPTTPLEAIQEVRRALTDASTHYNKSLSTLTTAEQQDLATNLYSTFNSVNGHTVPNRGVGKRLCATMMKMDRAAMHNAGESLIPLTDKDLLAQLAKLPEDAFPTVMINGQKVQRIATPAGAILIGGRGSNVYDLDSMPDVACIIDLGGNDVYREGTCNINRPILVIIDLHGDDMYTGTKPGIQGSSILGVSMLLDLEGNDVYRAQDVAQGTTIGGIGILVDYAGDDNYLALRRGQGCALAGIGVLSDKAGNDKYKAALWAQGFGHPGGFGVLEDADGNDTYYVGGLYVDSYPEHPGYDGWGQGIGAGIRQTANGGIGMILDGGGDDTYEFDYFSHGGGYWLGLGVARDFGGNDQRLGATLTGYNGGTRSERRWQRFSNGFGCHYALGYAIDDAGDDTYDGTIMGLGMGWDLAIGFLLDFSGNDRYLATGGLTQGSGAEGSIGILYNYGGEDVYMGRNQGVAGTNLTYHTPSNCGSNFSFLIDYGGKDQYGSGIQNNTENQRGSAGGFLIDRPFPEEIAAEQAAFEKAEADRAAAAAANPKANTPANRRQPAANPRPRQPIESIPNLNSK